MVELFKENINRNIVISDLELEKFFNLFERKTFKKRQFLLGEGEVCNFEGFVIKGMLRIYHVDCKGFEHVLYFAVEDWWVTDIDSFTQERPSQLFIQALEDSEVLMISRKNKDLAYENIPSIEKLFRVMTQKTHVALQRRMLGNLSKTANLRYLDFTEKYPQLVQRLSNRQIAAYLGICHEFVSKIRKKDRQERGQL
jgi:CRP-like cAMP-binding protein